MGNDDKDRIRQEFAIRFRNALKELGYTTNQQGKMRELFGVSGQAVCKWAEGQAMPTLSRMPQVAAVLGVRRAWLQEGEEPMRPVVGRVSDEIGRYGARRSKELTMSAEEANVLHLYRILTPKQKEAVREVILLLAERKKKK